MHQGCALIHCQHIARDEIVRIVGVCKNRSDKPFIHEVAADRLYFVALFISNLKPVLVQLVEEIPAQYVCHWIMGTGEHRQPQVGFDIWCAAAAQRSNGSKAPSRKYPTDQLSKASIPETPWAQTAFQGIFQQFNLVVAYPGKTSHRRAGFPMHGGHSSPHSILSGGTHHMK